MLWVSGREFGVSNFGVDVENVTLNKVVKEESERFGRSEVRTRKGLGLPVWLGMGWRKCV